METSLSKQSIDKEESAAEIMGSLKAPEESGLIFWLADCVHRKSIYPHTSCTFSKPLHPSFHLSNF